MSKAFLRALYAELPTIKCQQKCPAFCGPIHLATSVEEWDRMTAARGYVPEPAQPLDCEFLKDGRCSVYQVRPLICRLWGVVEAMICPWGCKPEPRYLTSIESYAFIHRLINGGTQAAALAYLHAIADKVPPQERLTWGEFEGSAELTLKNWSEAERNALLQLRREGNVSHMAKATLDALDLLEAASIRRVRSDQP